MTAATYRVGREVRAGAAWRSAATPMGVSIVVHIVLLSLVGGMSWSGIREWETEEARIFSIETGTVDPGELEPIALVPLESADDVQMGWGPARLVPGALPAYRGAVPAEAVGAGRVPSRAGAGEFPVASGGLSRAAVSFLREGEREVAGAGPDRLGPAAPPRVVGRPAGLEEQTVATSREKADVLAGAVSSKGPSLAALADASVLAVPRMAVDGVLPVLAASKMDRDAEGQLADRTEAVFLAPVDLDVRVEVYVERETKDRFFRMTISEQKGSKLGSIPKNVLFVVDISASIGLEALKGVASAIGNGAGGFNAGDKFNVVRFSEQTFKTFEGFVPATRERLAEAARSVRRQPGQIQTDVYAALSDVVAGIPREGPDAMRPTQVWLVSDGNPTAGMGDVRQIVTELSRVMRPTYGIFALNPGAGMANSYLLDLLAFRNRGTYVRAASGDVADVALLRLLSQYKDPVLVNVRAQYGNFEAERVYPEVVPNLYAGRPIVVHGRCLPGEVVAVRVLASTATERREFVYAGRLPEVLTEDGTIAREWARGRIHALAARIVREGEKKEYMDEIRRLSRRYELAGPSR